MTNRPRRPFPIRMTGVVVLVVGCLGLFGCSSNGKSVSLPMGGATTVEGGARTGGSTVEGGSLATGGTTSTGGASSSGGSSGGGVISDGPNTGGTLTGGTMNTGGIATLGGAVPDAGPDVRGNADTRAGGNSTGGSLATGGVPSPGGNTDGCDIGVSDPATPPKVLSLSGNLGVHDPAVLASNGTYYLFATGLGAKTSTNLTTWTAAARPFTAPAWLTTAVPGVTDLWAPDISSFGGKFHLYYSGSTFGSNKSCIGHATRDAMATGSWTDQGSATLCSNVGTTDNWNAIDPNVVLDTAGTPWLVFGSFWSGLKIVQLNATGVRVGTTVTDIAARPSKGGALEAPFMVRRCGYYYLFMSWDKCCVGADSTYNIRVVRGTSVTGPFSDKAGTAALQGGGTLVTEGDATWAGPGHEAVLFVGAKAYLVYHAYAKSNGSPTLRIAELAWDASGWPLPVGP